MDVTGEIVGRAAIDQPTERTVATRSNHQQVDPLAQPGELLARLAVDRVTVDPGNGQSSQFAVNGNATLAAGAKIGLNIISADPAVQTFTLVTTTGTLTSGQPAS